MCINNKPFSDTPCVSDLKKLIEGDCYTVLYTTDGRSTKGYVLEEVDSILNPLGFRIERFIPLSDIDETELVKERLQEA